MATRRPERSEAAEYYFKYIDQVVPGDIRATLETQGTEVMALLDGISEERSLSRYAPDKWTMRGVVAHINDTERLFAFRAMWFARGLDRALPSFDETIAMAHAGTDARSWRSHVDEFAAIRAATVALFRHLPDEAWSRRGEASGHPVSVRALAHITAGHVAHHVTILRERYLVGR